MYAQPYLQKYKGISTRHTCPECGQKQSFTLYLDGNTNEPIHRTVGKCNRESKCGYHYTPKQFFIDNPMSQPSSMSYKNAHQLQIPQAPLSSRRGVGGEVPFSYVQRSASFQSNFVRFLCEILTDAQIRSIAENYALGATKTNEVIFWQIDINGKIRTGKIMQYNPETGRRLKHESGAIDWVHNKLKKSSTIPENFNLQQCFFGEHLLTIYPNKTVAIVESEKSAIIASAVMPDLIWLAAGNLNGLTLEKCRVLKNKNVIFFPDLGAFEKWEVKARLLNSLSPSPNGEGFRVRCSTLLEDISTPEAKAKGLDVADFMIAQLRSKTPDTEKQNQFSGVLNDFINRNKAVKILIEKLQLSEIG
ncbi:MAG: DUF6371 domain-containing protein [Bacteroidales bacterium]|nr:DUF6371 domain-containing protein [Bacteroidales bacterium]